MSSSIFFEVFIKREYKPDNDNNSQTRSYVGSSNGSNSHFYECFGIGDLTKDSESGVGDYFEKNGSFLSDSEICVVHNGLPSDSIKILHRQELQTQQHHNPKF